MALFRKQFRHRDIRINSCCTFLDHFYSGATLQSSLCVNVFLSISAMRIHCSRQCKELLDKLGGFDIEERGLVELKVSSFLSHGTRRA